MHFRRRRFLGQIDDEPAAPVPHRDPLDLADGKAHLLLDIAVGQIAERYAVGDAEICERADDLRFGYALIAGDFDAPDARIAPPEKPYAAERPAYKSEPHPVRRKEIPQPVPLFDREPHLIPRRKCFEHSVGSGGGLCGKAFAAHLLILTADAVSAERIAECRKLFAGSFNPDHCHASQSPVQFDCADLAADMQSLTAVIRGRKPVSPDRGTVSAKLQQHQHIAAFQQAAAAVYI